jgi:hypothetical protein
LAIYLLHHPTSETHFSESQVERGDAQLRRNVSSVEAKLSQQQSEIDELHRLDNGLQTQIVREEAQQQEFNHTSQSLQNGTSVKELEKRISDDILDRYNKIGEMPQGLSSEVFGACEMARTNLVDYYSNVLAYRLLAVREWAMDHGDCTWRDSYYYEHAAAPGWQLGNILDVAHELGGRARSDK